MKLLDAIDEYWARHGHGPSFRDLLYPVTPLRSTSAVRYHLIALREQGLITYTPHRPRTIRTVPRRASGEWAT